MVRDGWRTLQLSKLIERAARSVTVEPKQVYQEIGIRSHGKGLFDKEPVLGAALGNKRVFWIEPHCLVLNIVFAWKQAVGKTTEADVGKIASHRFPMYRPRPDQCDIDYLVYLFKTPYGKHLLNLASPGGAGRNKTLGQADFLKTVICVPPIDEQRRIVLVLATWDRALVGLNRLIANKESERQALSKNLFDQETRFPEFESNAWTDATLAECCSAKGEYGANAPAIPFSAGEPRYLRITDISDVGELIKTGVVSIKRSEAEGSFLSAGDIVLARSGATVGKSYLHRSSAELAFAGYLIRFRPRPDLLDPQFLFQFLRSDQYWRWVKRSTRAGAQPNINAKEYGELRVPVPPIAEQKKISRVLQKFDDQLRALRNDRNLLSLERNALMQQLLTGKRRVNAKDAATPVAVNG